MCQKGLANDHVVLHITQHPNAFLFLNQGCRKYVISKKNKTNKKPSIFCHPSPLEGNFSISYVKLHTMLLNYDGRNSRERLKCVVNFVFQACFESLRFKFNPGSKKSLVFLFVVYDHKVFIKILYYLQCCCFDKVLPSVMWWELAKYTYRWYWYVNNFVSLIFVVCNHVTWTTAHSVYLYTVCNVCHCLNCIVRSPRKTK